MGAAVAVHEQIERPGWLERLIVLGICAGLLVVLAIVDERAARREAARAQVVLSERAQRAAERSSREAMTAPVAAPSSTRTERLGRASPIVIAAGSAIGPATSIVAEGDIVEDTAPPAPQNVLRRVQGPQTSSPASAIPEPEASHSRAAPAPAAPAVTTGRAGDDEPLLLMLMAALGASMFGGGLRLVSRRSA